jgi:hypothetical protein
LNLPGLHDATVSHAQHVEGAEFDLLLRGVIFDERALVRAPINQAGNDLVPVTSRCSTVHLRSGTSCGKPGRRP